MNRNRDRFVRITVIIVVAGMILSLVVGAIGAALS
jgi:hypothetical protein